MNWQLCEHISRRRSVPPARRTPERSYPEILSSALDYRQWRVFSFTLISGEGKEDRLNRSRGTARCPVASSPSRCTFLCSPRRTSCWTRPTRTPPRLLALDEAFAGVDDNGRSELLGLSVQFDLDLFMTGYDLWITYAGRPRRVRTTDLAHSTAEQAVSARAAGLVER